MKIGYYVKIFLPLLLICAVIAGIVSGVQVLTKGKIAENEAKIAAANEEKKNQYIKEVYGDTVFTVIESNDNTVDDIRCSENGEYCVTVTSSGYNKKSIKAFVMFDKELVVLKVIVLSADETSGIGTKITNIDYLAEYIGTDKMLTLGSDIDAISGATRSSNGLLNGVNTARAAVENAIATAKGENRNG